MREAETLLERVFRYINLKQEGEAWDFKREWHHNKTDLLHDILCMSNLTCEDNGLLIIGVDEENDYALCDVEGDENRRDTHDVVKFLRDKKFDGGIRPTVHVEPLVFNGQTIDVIVVNNSSNVPYYLTERFEGVAPYHIYTRVGNTNTPVDRSADRDKAEKLWKRRFGIDKPTLDKFKIYLQDYDNWKSIDGSQTWYYEYAPEYRVELEYDEDRRGYEYYCFSQITWHPPAWFWLRLKYHSTVMHETLAISLDGGNFMTAIPSGIYMKGHTPFYYYIAGEVDCSLHKFFESRFDEANAGLCSFFYWNSLVPTFNSKEEATDFFKWLEKHEIPKKPERHLDYVPDKLLNGEDGGYYRAQFINAEIINEIFDEYRDEQTGGMS